MLWRSPCWGHVEGGRAKKVEGGVVVVVVVVVAVVVVVVVFVVVVAVGGEPLSPTERREPFGRTRPGGPWSR